MQLFDIYFSGKLLPDADPAAARQALGKLFKVQDQALERLFSGTPIRIKKQVDVETANRYRGAFRDAGALVDIVPHQQAAPAEAGHAAAAAADDDTQAQAQAAAGLSLLPPRTGSLEDCAPELDAPPLPDIDWMSLDAAGATLDPSPKPAEPAIDISGLSMSEANSGSLEDCAQVKPAQPIGDISHLQLVDGTDGEAKD